MYSIFVVSRNGRKELGLPRIENLGNVQELQMLVNTVPICRPEKMKRNFAIYV